MHVYISGPITGLSESEFKANFEEGVHAIKKSGYTALNPLDVRPDCFDTLKAPRGCNSGQMFDDGTYMHTWQCYMKYNIIAMMKCNAILMLPDWSKSKGADIELYIATGLGYQIFLLSDDGGIKDVTREYR